MTTIKGFLKRFTAFELVVIALAAAFGIAVKPIVVPLSHIITGPLMLPGGVVAGGIYMLWIVLGIALIGKTGTGTLIGFVQAIMVMVTGAYGTHGALSIVTYTLPGLAADLVLVLSCGRYHTVTAMFIAGAAANITGTIMTTVMFFRLPLIPLLLGLCTAALSGGFGGIIAFKIAEQLKRYGLFR
jgi:hypothetical protein